MRLIVMMVLGWSIAGASAAAWRLPLPVGPGDVSGALVRMGGEVYQAADFGLQATADGEIAISWMQGYDANGMSVRIERTVAGATPMGFARVAVGVDGAGYLLVGTGGALFQPSYPCGPTTLQTCHARNCEDCGTAPACACLDVTGGGCDPLTHEYCEGTCPAGTACNPVGDYCGCSPAGSTMPPQTTQPPGKKGKLLEPVNPPE